MHKVVGKTESWGYDSDRTRTLDREGRLVVRKGGNSSRGNRISEAGVELINELDEEVRSGGWGPKADVERARSGELLIAGWLIRMRRVRMIISLGGSQGRWGVLKGLGMGRGVRRL